MNSPVDSEPYTDEDGSRRLCKADKELGGQDGPATSGLCTGADECIRQPMLSKTLNAVWKSSSVVNFNWILRICDKLCQPSNALHCHITPTLPSIAGYLTAIVNAGRRYKATVGT